MTEVTVAATQFAMSDDRSANIEKAVSMVRHAAVMGANIVLLPELFEIRCRPLLEARARNSP